MARTGLVQVPAQVVGFQPRADRSYKLSFETREISGDEVAYLADNYQGTGWLVFRANAEVLPDEVPEEDADSGVKSPSERLRAVLYLLWKKQGSKGDFEAFRRTHIEKYIELVKSKLND